MQIGQLSGAAAALVLVWLETWRRHLVLMTVSLMGPWDSLAGAFLFSSGPVYLITWDELLFSKPRKGRARRERPRNLNEDSNKGHKGCIPTWQDSNISVLISHIRSKNTRDVLGILTTFFFFSFYLSASGKYIYLDKIFSRHSFFV